MHSVHEEEALSVEGNHQASDLIIACVDCQTICFATQVHFSEAQNNDAEIQFYIAQ
jgi:hypothetical protein